MNINNEYLKTYKFHNRKNQSVAIYGKFKENSNKLLIFVLTLNSGGKNYPAEKFSKKNADAYFQEYLEYREGDEHNFIKPLVYSLPAEKGNYRNAFLEFCESNFFKCTTINLLIAPNKMIKINNYFNEKQNTDRIDSKSLRLVTLSEKQQKAIQEEMDNFDLNQQTDIILNNN